MWTYDRGQSCNYTEDIPGPSQVACWIVDRTGAYLMEEQAQRIEHNLEPLLDANSVREPLREAVNAIRDGSPMWLPRRVDWAYYKRISETIHTLESIVPSTEKPASLGRTVAADVEFVDIPPDNRTRPMSKTELAEIWGEEVNQKDINQMIDAGALLVIPLSRQKFIFDKAKLPTGVLEKLKQIG